MDNGYNIKRSDFPDEKSFQIALRHNQEQMHKYPKQGMLKAWKIGNSDIFEGMRCLYQP